MQAHLDHHSGVKLGALLLEPVLQGAGGMLCVDPQFQRSLIQVGIQPDLGLVMCVCLMCARVCCDVC
jgi:adenosylmethionine-8-amino-7-oxononanoate aminotransferase